MCDQDNKNSMRSSQDEKGELSKNNTKPPQRSIAEYVKKIEAKNRKLKKQLKKANHELKLLRASICPTPGIIPSTWYEFNDACDAGKIVQSHRDIILKNHKGKNDGLETWGNDLKCFGQFIIDCHRKYGREHAEDKSNRSKTE